MRKTKDKNTMISEELTRLQMREQLDNSAKILLGYRVICAFILKHCVKELEGYDADYIAKKCILGDPVISKAPVHQHAGSKMQNQSEEDKPEKVPQGNSEDADPDEGTVRYDIIFEVLIPGETVPVKLIINIEAQNKFNPGYPLVTRGFYYDARMISAQYGKEFTDSEYGKIKKVYSVWICINPDDAHRNTITRYHTTAENIFGSAESNEEDYDKMEVIIVGLKCDAKNGEESENALINMLSILFSKKTDVKTKKEKLQSRHGIQMKKKYNEVIEDMCNISGYYTEDYDNAIKTLNATSEKLVKAENRAKKAEADIAAKDAAIAELKAHIAMLEKSK